MVIALTSAAIVAAANAAPATQPSGLGITARQILRDSGLVPKVDGAKGIYAQNATQTVNVVVEGEAEHPSRLDILFKSENGADGPMNDALLLVRKVMPDWKGAADFCKANMPLVLNGTVDQLTAKVGNRIVLLSFKKHVQMYLITVS